MKFFALLPLFTSLALWGQSNCKQMALRNGFSEGLPDSKILKKNDSNLSEARDQDSIGYCYAYATADMYETWLKNENFMNKNESVSAVAFGLADHKENWDKRTQEFNLIKPAPEQSLQARYEESSALYEKLVSMSGEFKAANAKIIQEKYADQYAKIQALNQSNKAEDRSELDALKADLTAKLNSEEAVQDLREQFQGTSKQLDGVGYPLTISSIYKIQEIDVANKDNKYHVQGGQSQDLLGKLWDSYCFENEVSSKDIGIKKIYTDYRDLLDDASISPNTINSALGYINSQRDEERNTCASLAVTQTVFQSLPFSGAEEFKQFLTSADPQRSLVQQLLEKSCSSKAPPIKPSIKSTGVQSFTLPIENNEEVLSAIDTAIGSGQIASVGYNVNILLTPDSNQLGSHESTIVGSAKLCGEDAYILRNTYGTEACKSFLDKYMKKAQEKLPLDMEYALCIASAQDKTRAKFKSCKTDDCLSKQGNFEQQELSVCYDMRDKHLSEQVELPYACDEKGNFVIPKSNFKKAVYLANYIDN